MITYLLKRWYTKVYNPFNKNKLLYSPQVFVDLLSNFILGSGKILKLRKIINLKGISIMLLKTFKLFKLTDFICFKYKVKADFLIKSF